MTWSVKLRQLCLAQTARSLLIQSLLIFGITAANQPQMNVLTLIDELASSIKMVLTLDHII
jgi:hypothetical protein